MCNWLTGWWIDVRNWLFVKLANGSVVVLNATIEDGTLVVDGKHGFVCGCTFRTTNLDGKVELWSEFLEKAARQQGIA